MTWNALSDFTTGRLVSASDWNKMMGATGNLATLWTPPAAFAYRTTAKTIPSNTFTAIDFDAELYDTDAIHDNATNPTRLTCRTAGKYLIVGVAAWNGVAGPRATARVRLNADARIGQTTVVFGETDDQAFHAAVVYDLAVGDYVELELFQISGVDKAAYGQGTGTTLVPRWGTSLSMAKVA